MHHLIRTFVAVIIVVSVTATAHAAPPWYSPADASTENAPVVKSRAPHLHANQVKVFLSNSHLFQKEDIDDMAYIIGIQGDRLIADTGKLVYGRNLDGKKGKTYDIVRPGETYYDYETGTELGVSGRHVGTAVILGGEDPKTLRVKSNTQEIYKGDKLIPRGKNTLVRDLRHPRRARSKVAGHIIDIQDGVFDAGQYQIVAIDRGSNSGLKPGDILTVNRHARHVVDPWAAPKEIHTGDPVSPQVVYTPHNEFIERHEGHKGNLGGIKVDTTVDITTLPEESAGHIMVYRTYDNVSYALVTDAVRSISIGFPVYNP